MTNAAHHFAHERLRDGRRIEIRALRSDDRANLLAAVDRTSDNSLYRRFFGPRRYFSEQQIDFFVDIDFVNHVALVAVAQENCRAEIVAGGRYIVTRPTSAEVAFTVIDQYQGLGIGSALLCHLVAIARDAGLKELTAEVLPENLAMLKVFNSNGLTPSIRREARAVHVTLNLV